MKILMVIYSQTGNTYSVAQRLQERLIERGHQVDMVRLGPEGSNAGGATKPPAPTILDGYQGVVFGAPVQAFTLAADMAKCMGRITSLQGKTIALLVTQHFPYPWLGGNRAIRKMKAICQAKGGTIKGSHIVNWSSPRREQMIAEGVDRLSTLF